MPNTTFSTTSIKHLAELVSTAPSVVPDLGLISTRQTITTDPEQSSEIPNLTDIGTVQTENFDYEASNVVVDNIPAQPTKFALPFSVITADQQAAGLTVRQLINAAVSKFEAAVWDAVVAPLLAETNFSSAVGVASSAFGGGDVDTLLASVTGRERVIVAHGDYTLKIKPTMLPATGTTKVLECSRWLTAGDGIRGFVSADRRGLVVQSGVPLVSPNMALRAAREIVALPGLGLPVELSIWHNAATKSDHACLTAYVSAAVADGSGLKLLKSSAE